MPDLLQSLKDQDLGHLQIVAELWGVDLEAPDARTALPRLVAALRQPDLVAEVVESLPPEALSALQDLCTHQGRLPWPLFTRRYGSVRPMGPARRDRQRPQRAPISPAEYLWYRALVARAFFDTPTGPEEFAYIPEDLLDMVRQNPALAGASEQGHELGRPARPDARNHLIPATDHILDHLCTMLAALRVGLREEEVPGDMPVPWRALLQLAEAAGLLGPEGVPAPEPTRAFLEAGRGEALAWLIRQWLSSERFNELRLIPHLQFEGAWENDPLHARQTVLGFLRQLPPTTWWSLSAFVEAVREVQPDFQRPAGDYDSWFIRDRRTGAYLRGFDAWDEVDGAYLRFMLSRPLYWLGIVDLAAPEEGGPVTAFRFSAWAEALLGGVAPGGLPQEQAKMHVRSDGQVAVPPLAPRTARYQLARFCAWEGQRAGAYRYRLTPGSLERARQQGLQVHHLLALLQRHAEAMPPSIVRALKRWEAHGAEARLEQVAVLRLRTPEQLQALRRSRAARFLGDPLGPTAVIVQHGAAEKVLAVLAEMGYLGEIVE